jgi:hypothetical protein
VRLEGLSKLKKLPHRESNPRPVSFVKSQNVSVLGTTEPTQDNSLTVNEESHNILLRA